MENNISSEFSNKEGIPNDLSSSFQRKYSIKLKFRNNSFINVTCLFNKNNTNLRFFIPDAKELMEHGFFFKYHKNILSSPFFSKELKINSIVGDKFNIINQFDGIRDNNNVRLITNETIVLGVVKPEGRDTEFKQTFTVYIFRDMKLTDNACYYIFLERQHNDLELGKKFVRSVGLELYDTNKLNISSNDVETEDKE